MSWLIAEYGTERRVMREEDISFIYKTLSDRLTVHFKKGYPVDFAEFDKIYVKKYDSISEALVALKEA